MLCNEEDCGKDAIAKSLCRRHYMLSPERPRCKEEGCNKPMHARRWCLGHYVRWRRQGELGGEAPLRVKRPRGAGTLTPEGYIKLFMPEHPMATKQGYVMQHRLVMSEYIGRPLLPGETVHHKNGVTDDNRLENLELWSSNHPAGQRHADTTAWAVGWLQEHAPELLKS